MLPSVTVFEGVTNLENYSAEDISTIQLDRSKYKANFSLSELGTAQPQLFFLILSLLNFFWYIWFGIFGFARQLFSNLIVWSKLDWLLLETTKICHWTNVDWTNVARTDVAWIYVAWTDAAWTNVSWSNWYWATCQQSRMVLQA